MAKRFTIGEIEVTVVSDGEVTVPATTYFPGTTAEQWQPHARLMDHQGNLTFPFSSFVIRSGDRTVMIDAGIGNRTFGPVTGGPLIGELREAGFAPEDIEAIFCTHLHFDHYGHIVDGDGASDGLRLVFPNAALHWTDAEQAAAQTTAGPDLDTRKAMIALAAGRWQPKNDGDEIAPGVQVVSMPGHTPGHAAVVISSGTQRALVLGDGISCPAQLSESEWSGLGDVDPKLARASQQALMREFEDGETLVAAAHFPGLTFGRVLMGEGRRYWQPVS